MKFSERQGITQPEPFQLSSMDSRLRNKLWTALRQSYLRLTHNNPHITGLNEVLDHIWLEFFGEDIDTYYEMFDDEYAMQVVIGIKLRERFMNLEWFEVYELIESLLHRTFEGFNYDPRAKLCDSVNRALEAERAGYRLIDGMFAPITSPAELSEVKAAISANDVWEHSSIHLQAALKLLAPRENFDEDCFRLSIKESISAVESICRMIAGEKVNSLGVALNKLDRGGHINKQLKSGLEKLYAYTNGPEGIRHALMDEPSVTFEEAKFMLVTCSAFVNLLKPLARQN